MSKPKNYTREEYIYLAKLYERAERFPDMVKSINKFVELDPKLTKDERNILSAGYKNIISDKRASWRLLNSMEKKEEKKNSPQTANIRLVKNNIEKELNDICNEIQIIIDKYLVPNASDSETKVFFLKLKGDYYRYKCEFATGKEFDDACSKAEKVYKEAYDIANKDIPISSSTRLGLALNYSVFFYEIKKIIDKYLLPNAQDIENKVFYLKLKADFYRYKCEFLTGKDFEDTCTATEKIYKEGSEIANKELPINNSTRLGLALNYSVFYYEIKKAKDEAIIIAKNAFDESMKILDDLEISKAKDTLLIIQLLKENLISWCTEMNEEES